MASINCLKMCSQPDDGNEQTVQDAKWLMHLLLDHALIIFVDTGTNILALFAQI